MAREMKDSGIEWIGEIPKEWEMKRLKSCILNRTAGSWGENEKGNKNDYICIRIADFDFEKLKIKDSPNYEYTKRNYNDETIKKLLLKNDDILIEKSGGGEKTPVGRTILYQDKFPALYANFIERLRVNNFIITPKFMQFSLVAFYKNKYILNYIKQTTGIQNLDIGAMLSSEKLAIPALQVQEKIANYLDKKVADIDLIIEKTKATIEDYKKYKQSIITEAVTKGLNPNVEMKETDNIHIKFIPKSWELKKLKYLFSIKKEIAGKKGFDVLSITQKGIKIKDISTNEGQMSMDYSKYQLLNKGDFAMNHMDLLTGWVDISQCDGVTSPDYRVFVLNDEMKNSKIYYLYLMQICYSNRIFYGLGQGVSNLGRWRLQAEKFLNFSIPVPPLQEQEKIADYLDKKVTEIDNLITKKVSLISEMEEYKKSLIYECVTGKKEIV